MYSHRDLLLHSICDILPQNILPPFFKTVISSVLLPSVALRKFWFFSPVEETWGRSFYWFYVVLDSVRTMHGPAEHFIHQEQSGNLSRIWLCNIQSHAKISSIVMQDLSMACLTPRVLAQLCSSMGGTPFMWNASSAKWHGIFSQWDRSVVFDKKYQKTCLACAMFT